MTSIDTPAGWVRRLVAVIVAMAATTCTLVGAAAPAGAAVCSSSSGVSVVVDFTGATGGVQSVCVAGGAGQSADQVITSAGFALTPVTRQPGFICRVNGVPADDPCVNTPPPDAYWGVFWSDGTDGAWNYADIGAGGLQVPDGGYIGLAWQTGTRREPGEAATAHPVVTPTATPTTAPTSVPTTPGTTKPTKNPTKKPTRTPTTAPSKTPTSTPTSTTTTTTPPASPTRSSSTTDPSESATQPPSETPSESPSSSSTDAPSSSATAEPSASATESSTATPSDATSQAESRTEESDRVPTWLTLAILISLLVAIGMSTYAARRRTRH